MPGNLREKITESISVKPWFMALLRVCFGKSARTTSFREFA